MKIIPLAQHQSQLDPTAKLVCSQSLPRFNNHSAFQSSIYSVQGGYVVTVRDKAVEGVFNFLDAQSIHHGLVADELKARAEVASA